MSNYDAVYDGTRRALQCDAAGIIERVAREMFDVSWLKSRAQEAIFNLECQLGRPFVLLRPRMLQDGNQWCALYGDNLQDGVVGFGDSPELAAYAFDKAWNTKVGA